MSERWISQKRHFCKYCRVWIADNKVSHQLHENGKTHKEHAKKFIDEVQKRGIEAERENFIKRSEMARIEAAATAKFEREDLGIRRPPPIVIEPKKEEPLAPPKRNQVNVEKIDRQPKADYHFPTSGSGGSGGRHPYGSWSVATSSNSGRQPRDKETDDDDEDEDGRKAVDQFKFKEKQITSVEVAGEDGETESTFKKRKTEGKQRAFRQKDA